MTANFRYFLALAIALYLFNSVTPLFAQDIITGMVNDTSVKEPETIPMDEISVRSADLMVTTRKMMESIISDEMIQSIDHRNDSLLGIVKGFLIAEKNINLKAKNRRFLNNKISFWGKIKSMVNVEKDLLAGKVQALDKKKYDLEQKSKTWRYTREKLSQNQSGSSVFVRIDRLTFMLDSMGKILQTKSDKLLKVLDRTTSTELLVEEQIEMLQKILNSRTEAIFVLSQPPVWNIDIFSKDNTDILGPLKQFYQMELRDLKFYFRASVPNIVIELFILLLTVFLFQVIKRKMLKYKINEHSFYQRMLVKILLHPISAALILGIFATIIVFPNRPLILRDFTIITTMIPMLIIATTLTPTKYRTYYHLMVVLMLLQFSYFIYPSRHLLYQLGMLSIAIIELITVFSLYRNFVHYPLKSKFADRLVKFIILVHIGFALTGFIGLISGASFLAEITLGIVILNAFVGILLITASLIVNGLLELALESNTLRKMNVFRLYGSYLAPRLIRLVNLGASIYWLYIFMSNLNIHRIFIEKITDFLNREINIGSASFTLIGIVIFFLVLWLSIIISKMLRVILEEDVLNHLKLAKGLPHTISVLVRYTLVTIGLMLAVSAAGMPLDNLTIIFGAFGVGIGFGLQNIFNNLVSGLILLFERPIQIGDTIEVGQLMGNVKSIGIRSSNVRTFDGAEVIVPNGQLVSTEVVNWTLSDQARRIEVIAGVSYGSDPHKVKSLFEKILREHPDIIQEPEPRVLFNDLGSSSLDFRLLFWTSNFDEWLRIRSEVIFSIFDVLKAEGIEIPFPQQDLHLRSVDPNISFGKEK